MLAFGAWEVRIGERAILPLSVLVRKDVLLPTLSMVNHGRLFVRRLEMDNALIDIHIHLIRDIQCTSLSHGFSFYI